MAEIADGVDVDANPRYVTRGAQRRQIINMKNENGCGRKG